jgi:hypothetical protein
MLLISAHYQFLQGGWMCCYFPRTVAWPSLPYTGWVRSTLCLHQKEVKFSLLLLGHHICPGGVHCSHKFSNNLVADDVSSLPGGGVAVSLSGMSASGSQKSKVLCLWIMMGLGCPRCLQNLFCFSYLDRGKKKEKKEKEKWLSNLWLAVAGLQHPGFRGCYML